MKTGLVLHTKRHSEESKGYIAVRDSASFVQFGNHQMSVPGPKSKLKARTFLDLKAETVQARKAEVGKVGISLSGITFKYQYVCQPDGMVRLNIYVQSTYVYPGDLEALPMLLSCLHGHVLGPV